MAQELTQAKYLGGIGSLLSLFSWVPGIGWLTLIVSMIMEIIAVKKISDLTQKWEIFRNFIISIILTTISIAIILGGSLSLIFGIGVKIFQTTGNFGELFKMAGRGMGLFFLLGWILFCLGEYFYWQSFKKIGEETKNELFKIAGLIFFVGALSLIILIGGFLMVIGLILKIVAYFSLPESLPQKPS